MARSQSPDISDIGQALDSLVHQFADPWAFLRELVQNAIDAGSPEIEVDLEHDEARGTAVILVRDFGEGMNREIIDTRLTRLFSSSKEGDYTKIGRFGIGFVSVFAIDPELVCVDTGRAGEYWRVVFRADRSFERIRLNDPVEGTTVRLFKRLDAAQLDEARSKAREVLGHWCKHARVEVRLEGEPISGPMTLDGPVVVEHQEEGTHVVMGWAPEAAALRGYYHGGLTLHEEHDASLPFVAFKIDSRFLEHTLTRDNVLRDDNYAKAIAIIQRVAAGPLVDALFEAIERRLTESTDPGAPDVHQLFVWAEQALLRFEGKLPAAEWMQRAVVPQLGAPPCSFAELRRLPRGRAIYCGREVSPVSERLRGEGHLVLAGSCKDPLVSVAMLGAGLVGRGLQSVAELCTALPLPDAEADAWVPLRRAVAALLDSQRYRISAVQVGRFDYPESPLRGRVAITQAKLDELTPIAEASQLSTGWLGDKRVLVLAADHPTLVHLREIAEREPELAAYLALKHFFLDHPPSADAAELVRFDQTLADQAAQLRCQRATP